GGTLLVTPDGTAVAADPDRDSVFVIDLDTKAVRAIRLLDGDAPGRGALGAPGQAWFISRRLGVVFEVDIDAGEVAARHEVCREPRGLGYDAATEHLHVACRSGALV